MPVVSSSVNWMVPGGKECFPVSIDGYRILFPGDYVTNEGFENADIRSEGRVRNRYNKCTSIVILTRLFSLPSTSSKHQPPQYFHHEAAGG